MCLTFLHQQQQQVRKLFLPISSRTSTLISSSCQFLTEMTGRASIPSPINLNTREDGCNGFQGVSRLSGLSLQGFSGFLEQGALDVFPDVGVAVPAFGVNGIQQTECRKKYPFELLKAIHNVQFIQTHMQRQDEFDSVRFIDKAS